MASLANRVKETSTISGLADYDLDGPEVGFQGFVAGLTSIGGSGSWTDVPYVAVGGSQWEVGYGIVTDAAPDTLDRITIIDSSAGGAKVSWPDTTAKNIFIAPDATLLNSLTDPEASNGFLRQTASKTYDRVADPIPIGNLGIPTGTMWAFFGLHSGSDGAGGDIPSGWLSLIDQTIGSASSGADYANADAENLFKHIWNIVKSTFESDFEIFPSTGPPATTYGATADADWTANKRISLPKALGRALVVADPGADGTHGTGAPGYAAAHAFGSVDGAEKHKLTDAEMPSHEHNPIADSHNHPDFRVSTSTGDNADRFRRGEDQGATTTLPSQTINVDESIRGSDDEHNNLGPRFHTTVIIKL